MISYEEYHPYGTSAYRATNSEIEVSPNRYRFTGMERDDETGLALHGARYYAPWLGRWTASDPLGLADGVNRYAYCRGSPVTLIDPSGTTGERPVTVHSNRRARLESEAYDIERDAARLDAAERENRAALRAELGPEGLANQERDHAVVEALLATASGISYGKRQIAARRAELAKDQAQLEEDEAIQARFRTTGKVVKGATIGTAVLVGAITFAGYFGMQGVIGAAKALLEADAAASGLPLTVAVVGGTTAKATGLVDDAAGVVDDAMGLVDDAGGLVDDAGAAVKSSADDALRAARGGGDRSSPTTRASEDTVTCQLGDSSAARDLPWPSNAGFADRARGVVPEGTIVDRIGRRSGRFASEGGTSVSERGLPPGSEALPFERYRVVKPFEADVGHAGPVPEFGATGGAKQYLFDKPVQWMLDNGYLQVVR